MDSSAGRDDRQEQIGPDVEAAAGDTSAADVVLGPNEGSSTGNVTGGRKLARYDFGRRPDAIPHATSSRQVRHCTPVQTNVHAPAISALVPAASTASSETS